MKEFTSNTVAQFMNLPHEEVIKDFMNIYITAGLEDSMDGTSHFYNGDMLIEPEIISSLDVKSKYTKVLNEWFTYHKFRTDGEIVESMK